MDSKERFNAISEANVAGHVGFCRELCEAFLADYPDHGPTLLMLSMQLSVMHLYEDAHRLLDRAEQVVPEQRRKLVLAQRAELYDARGQHAEAKAAFLQAHHAAPDDATYLIYAGIAAARQGEIERALMHHTKATQCQEGCIDEAHFNRGGSLLTLKRYPEAIVAYREALRLDPDYKLAKNKLRDLELLMGLAD